MSTDTTPIEEHLSLLGTAMKDRVTQYAGMVDAISFDTYGCVQASLKPKIGSDGKVPNGYWFDVKRLITNGKRIMDAPSYVTTPVGREIGAADKPVRTDPKRQ